MRLSSLKLSGFKSFADSTTLHFKENRTAVVGPNGCGKSNVIDAIRWVMGESSARQLRGGSMQDVIFTGTAKRKPVSVASVELRFDNTYGKLGGSYNAYTELAVKRQVNRDGKSEYFLNGTKALLLLERTHLIEIYPRRGAIVSEMSAQQVRALFDISSLLLGQIVQRIAETWRSYEAESLQLLLDELGNQLKQGSIEKFYDLIFEGLARQHEMVGNAYLMKFYQELLPSIRRSYFLTLNTSRRELQESYDLFKLVTDAVLIRKSQQATLFMEDFCRHLRNLVLESLTRMKQIELAWARRSRR